MRGFSKDMNRIAAVLTCAFVALAGCAEQPTQPVEVGDEEAPQLHHRPGHGGGGGDGGGGGQATYEYTFSGHIESPALTATASSKDPFGAVVDIENGTLQFPSNVNLTTTCSTKPNLATDWGGYSADDYTGSLQFPGPKGKKSTGGAVSLFVDANPTIAFLNLDVQGGTQQKTASTLTFTDAIALVGQGSHPPGGSEDARDRCVTFTITAVRQ